MLHFVQAWKLWLEKKLTIVPVKPASRMLTCWSFLHIVSSLFIGYEDMEAQFAWDDKTIRQTFIRKVKLCHVRQVTLVQKHIVSIALIRCSSSSCRCTPFSWFSCLSQWPLLLSSHFGNYSSSQVFVFLPLWLKPDLNPLNSCLHSAPVRFFIQTHPGLYMAS